MAVLAVDAQSIHAAFMTTEVKSARRAWPKLPRPCGVDELKEDREMSTKIKLVLAAAIILGAASPAFAGWVVPCSLDGVNPYRHHRIFRHSAIAWDYGFFRSTDGAWLVRADCHR
jgi:hypothetical protein